MLINENSYSLWICEVMGITEIKTNSTVLFYLFLYFFLTRLVFDLHHMNVSAAAVIDHVTSVTGQLTRRDRNRMLSLAVSVRIRKTSNLREKQSITWETVALVQTDNMSFVLNHVLPLSFALQLEYESLTPQQIPDPSSGVPLFGYVVLSVIQLTNERQEARSRTTEDSYCDELMILSSLL